jgi:hypothetical protein
MQPVLYSVRMKTFLAPKNHDAGSVQAAQGCLATNLALPGLGSLVGGRKIGYVQLGICLAGFALSLLFGVRLIYWQLAHWSEFYGPNPADLLVRLHDLWREGRWAVLGMALFVIALLWSLLTSRSLLAEAKKRAA